MFIQTETTPNPATLKFLPGREVIPRSHGTADFRNAESAAISSPLASRLFSIPGVVAVFLGSDFITITKDNTDWQHMKPSILQAIMEHFMTSAPIMSSPEQLSENQDKEEFYDKEDEKIVLMIKELLDTRIRPAVAQDGGDITFRGFKNGVVFLNMRGACSGCPSSTATLKHGIQNLLRHFIPEVQEVQSMSTVETDML